MEFDLIIRNGTVVDGHRVQEAVLKPGKSLTIGPLTFRADYEHNGYFPVLGVGPDAASHAAALGHPGQGVCLRGVRGE